MASVQLEIRNLETEEEGVAEFADLATALQWLTERPQFIEVLRPVDRSLDSAIELSLRKAMRPLDDAELAQRKELDADREIARKRALLDMNERELARGQPLTGATADLEHPTETAPAASGPDEVTIQWRRGGAMQFAGRADVEVPEAVRAVVLQWLRERDSWVHPRRQHVASATVIVGPDGVDETSQFATMPGLSDEEID